MPINYNGVAQFPTVAQPQFLKSTQDNRSFWALLSRPARQPQSGVS